MTEQEANMICDKIRQVAYDLHVYLGVGYLEKVYENGLAHRLAKAGMTVLRFPCPLLSSLPTDTSWPLQSFLPPLLSAPTQIPSNLELEVESPHLNIPVVPSTEDSLVAAAVTLGKEERK